MNGTIAGTRARLFATARSESAKTLNRLAGLLVTRSANRRTPKDRKRLAFYRAPQVLEQPDKRARVREPDRNVVTHVAEDGDVLQHDGGSTVEVVRSVDQTDVHG